MWRTSVKIAVCIKRVIDMETRFRIAGDGASIDEAGAKYDVNDFDMYAIEAALHQAVLDGWDADAVQRDVLASQRRRLFLKQADAAAGIVHDWNHQATRDDQRRFVRASGAAGAKARARFPFVS